MTYKRPTVEEMNKMEEARRADILEFSKWEPCLKVVRVDYNEQGPYNMYCEREIDHSGGCQCDGGDDGDTPVQR